MNGNDAYELKYEKLINNIIDNNSNLLGFYQFMSDKSISTVYNYITIISLFLEYSNKPLYKINIDDFTGFLLKSKRREDGRQTTSSHRINVYHALKKYGKYLYAKGILKNNPMDMIDRPSSNETQDTIEKRNIGYLEKSEIRQLFKTIYNGVGGEEGKLKQLHWRERDIAIINLFLTTGIRCSALVKLDVKSINFSENTMSVKDKEGKINSYDLNEDTIEILKEWLEKRSYILGDKEEDAFFISNRKQRVTCKCVSDIVKKYSSTIKGKHITPHKLRATYGTQLYNATNDIYFVQQCMKHSNPKTTELYIRGIKNNTKKASDIMNKLL